MIARLLVSHPAPDFPRITYSSGRQRPLSGIGRAPSFMPTDLGTDVSGGVDTSRAQMHSTMDFSTVARNGEVACAWFSRNASCICHPVLYYYG